MNTNIAANAFVGRQVEGSRFSYFQGSLTDVCDLAWSNWDKRIEKKDAEGKPLGIFTVPVPVDGFTSGIVNLDAGSKLTTTYTARRAGERPVRSTTADSGQRIRPTEVNLIVYSHEALGKDASTDWPFELVSINAGCGEPMNPTTMARNQLGLEGGTQVSYTPEEWAKAVWFWEHHCMAG